MEKLFGEQKLLKLLRWSNTNSRLSRTSRAPPYHDTAKRFDQWRLKRFSFDNPSMWNRRSRNNEISRNGEENLEPRCPSDKNGRNSTAKAWNYRLPTRTVLGMCVRADCEKFMGFSVRTLACEWFYTADSMEPEALMEQLKMLTHTGRFCRSAVFLAIQSILIRFKQWRTHLEQNIAFSVLAPYERRHYYSISWVLILRRFGRNSQPISWQERRQSSTCSKYFANI